MGGGVALQDLVDRPGRHREASLTLVDPVLRSGSAATGAPTGRCVTPRARARAAAAHPGFVARLAAGDRTDADALSPWQVPLADYVKPLYVPEAPGHLAESMLSTRTGDDHYPGTSRTVDAWRASRPATGGCSTPWRRPISGSTACRRRSPSRRAPWRGADDVIVSDTSLYDLAYLGSIGAVPGWPGAEAWPPQPMVAQTRAVLDGYAAAGGRYREVVIDDACDGPHLEQPQRFLAELNRHLSGA